MNGDCFNIADTACWVFGCKVETSTLKWLKMPRNFLSMAALTSK